MTTDRAALRALLGSLTVATTATAAYFRLPFSIAGSGLALLSLGLGAVAALLAWHLLGILRSPHPRVRAVAALATTIPLFLLIFATTYFVLDTDTPDSFSQHLGRLDALYFTVTVFATVGFGDIVPVSSAARAVTTVQMIGDLVLVGLVAQVIVGAVREGVRRRDENRSSADAGRRR